LLIDVLRISQDRIDGTVRKEIVDTNEVDEESYLKPLLKMIVEAIEEEC